MQPLDPSKLRDRLILAGVLSPAFLLLYLWIYFCSANIKGVPLLSAMALMATMAVASAYCVVLFCTEIKGLQTKSPGCESDGTGSR